MNSPVFVFDPTAKDELSRVRGIGRYLQIIRESFPDWKFTNDLETVIQDPTSILINPFFNLLQPPVLNKKLAAGQVAVIHDLIPLKYPSHFPKGLKGNLNFYANKQTLKYYDWFITDSQASKKDIIQILGIHEHKIRIVYPCLPKNFASRKNVKKPSETNYCLYVGDATWNKNLVNLAKAIKIADVPAVFVGKVFGTREFSHPWQAELRDFVKLTKGDQRFAFPGYVPDEELLQYYQNATLNALVSRDEGFGFSYLEASNLGIPSVLSDIPVLHEIAEEAALFANPEEPKDIAAKIKELFANDEIRQTVAQEAKERTKFFSAKNFKQEFLKAIAL